MLAVLGRQQRHQQALHAKRSPGARQVRPAELRDQVVVPAARPDGAWHPGGGQFPNRAGVIAQPPDHPRDEDDPVGRDLTADQREQVVHLVQAGQAGLARLECGSDPVGGVRRGHRGDQLSCHGSGQPPARDFPGNLGAGHLVELVQ